MNTWKYWLLLTMENRGVKYKSQDNEITKSKLRFFSIKTL